MVIGRGGFGKVSNKQYNFFIFQIGLAGKTFKAEKVICIKRNVKSKVIIRYIDLINIFKEY